jgi:hypothetical protein
MGLFSKLFGAPKPPAESFPIPEGATARDVMAIAVRSVVEKLGGNCATLQPVAEEEKWVQLIDFYLNCHYPHEESPKTLFPDLCKHPIVAGFEGYEAGVYMHISLKSMNPPEIVDWIERYFLEVLSVDLKSESLRLRMEDLGW